MEVCVIGAGVIGLSTAVAIQERVLKARVTIIADRFGEGTTSSGAAGLIVPVAKGVPEDIGRRWCEESAKYFHDLVFSPEAKDAGVSITCGFHLANTDQPSIYIKYCLNVNKLDQTFLQRITSNDKQRYKYGYSSTTCLVDAPVYLKWLTSRFLAKGGKIIKRKVMSLHELTGQYDVVVNCTGFGSQQLVKDPLLRPMKGQSVHVHAPWMKTYFQTEDTINIIPLPNSVFLGSIRHTDNADMTISDVDSEDILARTQAIIPALKGARVLWQWAGIRPERDSVRLEEETITTQGKPLKVIHNYGHGSFGISLSWGCALHVTRLVERLDKQRTMSKL